MHQHILKVSRLEGLTDGVFAIAMTILVLDLRIPRGITSADLNFLLTHDILYRLFIYVGSFVILGTLWIAMNFQIGLLDHLNRTYLWTHVLYMMVICVIPFSASLVASYPNHTGCVIYYDINLLCASLCQYLIFKVGFYYNLNRELYTKAIQQAVVQRILLAPIFYLIALLVVNWNTHVAFIFLLAPTLLYLFPGKIDKYETDFDKE